VTAAGRILAEALDEPPDPFSSSELVLLALPRMDPLPRTLAEIDELVECYLAGARRPRRRRPVVPDGPRPVQITQFDVCDIHDRPLAPAWIEGLHWTSEALQLYSSEPGRPYYIRLRLRFRPPASCRSQV
jgi:hypothetical protein